LTETEEIIDGILKGDRRSIARGITLAENDLKEAQKIVAGIYSCTGRAHVVGLTGPGGSGKSTLIEKIIREYRRLNQTVGVVAVDPTSPFTGGAFLGDRIRMQELTTDDGVFIRSMASRNHPGGLARATRDAVKILDAAGNDKVLVETVGAGQSEVDIIRVAQTVVVVHAPGLGDEIQAIKAGTMEIADVFVVNKADRENADKTVMDIQAVMQLSNKVVAWKPPILKTVGLTGEGVAELVKKLEQHRSFLEQNAEAKQKLLRDMAEAELVEAIKERTAASIMDDLRRQGTLGELLQKILRREVDPASAAEMLLAEKLKRW
jgi:LAO/AO transport system kinase